VRGVELLLGQPIVLSAMVLSPFIYAIKAHCVNLDTSDDGLNFDLSMNIRAALALAGGMLFWHQ